MATKDELIRIFYSTQEYSKSFETPCVVLPSNRVSVINENCFDTLHRVCKNNKERVAILNMANGVFPGGSVTSGSCSQEEFLCRVSTLYSGLLQAQTMGLYPLTSGFIVKNVTFFRDSEYNLLRNTFQADVITINAPCMRKDYGPFTDEQKDELIRCQIKKLFALAAPYNVVILGAFGCGAFKNPPEMVAQIMREAIAQSRHTKIYIPIIEDKNSNGSNFEIFSKILS